MSLSLAFHDKIWVHLSLLNLENLLVRRCHDHIPYSIIQLLCIKYSNPEATFPSWGSWFNPNEMMMKREGWHKNKREEPSFHNNNDMMTTVITGNKIKASLKARDSRKISHHEMSSFTRIPPSIQTDKVNPCFSTLIIIITPSYIEY